MMESEDYQPHPYETMESDDDYQPSLCEEEMLSDRNQLNMELLEELRAEIKSLRRNNKSEWALRKERGRRDWIKNRPLIAKIMIEQKGLAMLKDVPSPPCRVCSGISSLICLDCSVYITDLLMYDL